MKIYIVLRGVIFCYIELYRSAEYYDAYEIYYGMLRVLEDNRSMNLSFYNRISYSESIYGGTQIQIIIVGLR